MPVRAEDLLLAPPKVCVHLARKECVLGYVCLPRVVFEREEEEPDDADDDAEEGEVRRGLEHARIASQGQNRSCGIERSVRSKDGCIAGACVELTYREDATWSGGVFEVVDLEASRETCHLVLS